MLVGLDKEVKGRNYNRHKLSSTCFSALLWQFLNSFYIPVVLKSSSQGPPDRQRTELENHYIIWTPRYMNICIYIQLKLICVFNLGFWVFTLLNSLLITKLNIFTAVSCSIRFSFRFACLWIILPNPVLLLFDCLSLKGHFSDWEHPHQGTGIYITHSNLCLEFPLQQIHC